MKFDIKLVQLFLAADKVKQKLPKLMSAEVKWRMVLCVAIDFPEDDTCCLFLCCYSGLSWSLSKELLVTALIHKKT